MSLTLAARTFQIAKNWVLGKNTSNTTIFIFLNFKSFRSTLQPWDIGWPTGNGEKLSRSKAQLGQATCLAVA